MRKWRGREERGGEGGRERGGGGGCSHQVAQLSSSSVVGQAANADGADGHRHTHPHLPTYT